MCVELRCQLLPDRTNRSAGRSRKFTQFFDDARIRSSRVGDTAPAGRTKVATRLVPTRPSTAVPQPGFVGICTLDRLAGAFWVSRLR